MLLTWSPSARSASCPSSSSARLGRAVQARRRRAGFTLVEIAIVLLILTIVSAVVVPALVSFGRDRPLTTADALLNLLRDSRKLAVQQAATVTLVIDTESGRFRIDTVSAVGAGFVVEDVIELGAIDYMDTDQPRLRYTFASSGAAFGDSVLVRGSGGARMIYVDPLSGRAYAEIRY